MSLAMAEEVKFDARLSEGIAYFEQMLDVLPDDRTTLEFLVVAYAQQGETAKEEAMLARLARLMVRDCDLEALRALVPRLETAQDPQAKAILLRANALLAPPPDLTPEVPHAASGAGDLAELKRHAIASEIALAKLLKTGDFITEEECALIIEHLEASPSDERIFLISALQILEKENPTACERALAYLADQFETPPIPLASFEILAQLPPGWNKDLARLRGTVPFGRVGSVWLVALLNPSDDKLLDDITATLNGSCRFYLAEPHAIEAVLATQFGEREET